MIYGERRAAQVNLCEQWMKPRIVLKKDILLETICVEYLIIMGLLSDYIGFSMVWKIVFFIMLVFLCIIKRRYRSRLMELSLKNVFFWMVILLGLASTLLGKSSQYLFFNVKKWVTVILLLYLIDLLVSNEKVDIRSVLESHFYFLNFFWMINLIVLALQCTGNGFMIKAEWLAVNGFYKDQCSGLFGNSGTHRLSFFAIFMMVYDLRIAEEISESMKKKVIYAYILLTQFWMLYLSIFNDNKTLFALTPFFFFLFFIFKRIPESKMIKDILIRIVRYIRIIVLVGIGVAILLIYFPVVSEFVEEYVIQAAINLVSRGNAGSRGSIERLMIAVDALKEGYGFLLGDGLGTAALSEGISGRYRGYFHFSMSSMGSLVALGGVWFYLSFCLLYVKMLVSYLRYKKNRGICWLLCFSTVIGLTMYTTLFENMICTLWVCLIFIMYGGDNAKEADTVQILENRRHVGERRVVEI